MILLLDNYDSFTYNLVHYIEELGYEVQVARNDKITIQEIEKLKPAAIVISPGPCDPDKAGITLDLIESFKEKTPILGICLGHQSIAQIFGGKIVRSKIPMHGKTDEIYHKDNLIFENLPSPFIATRYHSLEVERDSLPDDLIITAETKDRTIMGVSHKTLNIHGLQFHPESIASEHGHQILKNFLSF